MESLNDAFVQYQITKQAIIESMNESKAPSQEMELFLADEMIRQAIIMAKSYVIKIRAVNNAAYQNGLNDKDAVEA